MTRPRAAVDSGTNSTRLLVVDADGDEVSRRSVITRLGAGVDANGRLDDGALERTLAVIREYRDVWREAGVDPADVRVAATSAVRDAADRDRYFDAVVEETGVRAEVLSGDEEARLSFAGAAGAVEVDGPVLVIDVGGGSTELIVGDADGRLQAAQSMQVGAVRVTERCLPGNPPTRADVEAARSMIAEELEAAEGALAIGGGALSLVRSVVGVAGTVTTLAAVHADAASPDDPSLHGHRIPVEAVSTLVDRLLAMTVEERAALTAMPAGRADVIAGGALVLEAVLLRAGVDRLVVSRADILDGLVADG